MGIQGALAAGALALSAAGTAVSITQNRKATRAQEEADSVSRAQAEIENQKEIRRGIIQSRIAQAQTQAAGEAQGAGDSSGIQGSLSSARAQLSSNVGLARGTQAANSAINAANSRANRAISNANTATAVGNLGAQFGFTNEKAFEQLGFKFGQV
jgi:hypothetical protein